jgi:hypothetical protein
MPSIDIDVSGDIAIAAELQDKSAKAGYEAFRVTRKWGLILQGGIVGGAQGRPGPRRRSGDYIRSWSTITSTSFASAKAEVGTNAPQARRLEYGFEGEDALGRRYNQAPLPHVRPAADRVEPAYLADLGQAIGF